MHIHWHLFTRFSCASGSIVASYLGSFTVLDLFLKLFHALLAVCFQLLCLHSTNSLVPCLYPCSKTIMYSTASVSVQHVLDQASSNGLPAWWDLTTWRLFLLLIYWHRTWESPRLHANNFQMVRGKQGVVKLLVSRMGAETAYKQKNPWTASELEDRPPSHMTSSQSHQMTARHSQWLNTMTWQS